MLKANYSKYNLKFKNPSGTSRGIMTVKETWFIKIQNESSVGVGECGLLRGLSSDDRDDYESKLQWTCNNVNLGPKKLYEALTEFPSIQFGLEMAFKSLESTFKFDLFPSRFTKGQDTIPINGLVWMGDEAFMRQQVKDKIESGFSCIKLKIGAIDFETELSILKSIRQTFSVSDIELRVDANGAFIPKEALEKLKRLSDYELHSIEQPIKPGYYQEMAALCGESPLPIALDEELIGIASHNDKIELIETIKPHFIILKPSLIGGYQGSESWITLAKDLGIGWWVTSALESNIGLNAIAQWTYTLNNTMPQGLGTGGLFTNNFDAPLEVKNGNLHYNTNMNWNFNLDL